MDGTEWKNSSGDDASIASTSGGVVNLKPKRRSLVERELETSLTTKVTLPNGNGEGSLNTSRYGRSRRAKTDNDFCDTEIAVAKIMNSQIETPSKPIVYNINILNSPANQDVEAKPNSATKLENRENKQEKALSIINTETTLTPDKIYVQKDLIQGKDETQISNMFSPNKNKTNSHINNILERSSEKYNLDLAVEKSSQKQKTEIKSSEKSTKAPNGVIDTSSVVKTLDFDTGKKKKPEEQKALSKSELFEIEAKCEYQVGDLAWARVGTYPFWPCIITREPYSELFVKRKLFGRTERDIIHVTFFADNGRRGWVVQHMLRPYCGRQEFEDTRDQFTLEDKKKDPRLYAAFFISDKKKDIWNLSVEEAETFLREPKRLRIDMLIEMLSNNKNVKVVKKPKSSKVSRTDSDVSLSESLYDTLFSEDDAKTEDTDTRRSRNKSLDVSEVVTACLDNMVAKTGIPIIQKQSHMDRWLQKAKSKTPEKPLSITPVKRQSLSLKKKQTPSKEKSRKNKESHNNLKAHQEEHDYTKFDIENENPVSNSKSTVSSDNQGYREHVNGVRLDYDVTHKAVTSDYNIETSIVDEVMDGEENENEVKESLEEKLLVESMNVDEDTDKKSDDLKASEPQDSVSKDVAKQNNMIDVTVEDFASENTKGEETSKSDPEKKYLTMKDIKNDSDDLSQAYSPDVSFEESKKTEKDGIQPVANSSTITCDIDLTSSDLEDTCKVDSIPSDKSADKTNKNTKKAKSDQKNIISRNLRRSESEVNIEPSTSGSHKQSVLGAISIKTPESLNKSISTSQEVSETNKSLGSSFSKSSNTKRKSQDRFSRRTVPMRDNRPKRKCANLGYTIGGTDDPEFLLYLETHQDSIIDENPDLNQEDVVNYLHKTWTYERDIKSDLLKDDDEDIITVEVNIAEERKKDKAVESVPSNNAKDNLPKDLQLVISFEDDQEEVTQSEKIKDSEAETHIIIETIKPTKTSQKQENNVEDENKESNIEPSNVEINENATVTKEKLETVESEPHVVKIDTLDKTKYDNVKVALKRENLEEKLKTSTKETKTTIQDDVANLMVIQEQKEDIRIVLQREDLEEKLKTTTNKKRYSIEKNYKGKPCYSGTKTKSPKETRVTLNEPKVNDESILPNKVQDVTTNHVVMQESKEVDILLHKSKSDDTIIGSFVKDPKSTTVAKTLPNETENPALNNIGENRILTLKNDTNSTDEIQVKKANGNDQVDSPVDKIENKVDKPMSESSAEKRVINNDLIQEKKQDENVSIEIPRTPKTKALAPEKEIMNKIPYSTPVSLKILEASASNKIKSPKLDSKSPTVKNKRRRSINPSQTEIKKDNVQASPVVKPKEPPTPVLIQKKIVSKPNETINNRPNDPVTLLKKVSTNKTIESAEPTANFVSNQNSNKIPINEKDIPVPKKILVRSASKPIQKEPVVSEGFVDLTEEDDESDDDIPSPEFEVHTVDSKEKEFIDELRKSVLPELMKDIDFKIKKEVCEPEDQTTEKIVESETDKPKKGGSKPSKDGKSFKNIKNYDEISLDGFTEDALLQSDEEADEVLNSSRLESFENVAKGRTNDLDISRSEDISNNDNVENMEVDEAISPKVNRISFKNKSLSLKNENGKIMHPNHIENIGDKEFVLPVKIPEKVIEKPMVNGCVDKLTIKNISSQPFVVHHVATEKDKSPKMNGCLNSSHKPNDKGALTNGLDIGHKDEDVITQARSKRKLRSKSDSNKKAYNAFDDPEFMVYVESRQDAVMDENPDLSEEDVVKYLHKTWMYEQENKSDRQRDDDIEQSNLVKGLVTQTAKPKKVRRKTSAKSDTSSKNEPVVRIERMDFTEKRTRRRKIIPNGISEDESIDSDCEIVPNSNVLDTISIFSGPDSTSDYVPSDDDSETSSSDNDDEISLATMKAVIRKDIKLEDDNVDPTHELLTKKGEPMINNLGVHEEVHLSPDHMKHEDLITPEDLNIVEKKPRTSEQMLSPISSPIKSDMSDESKSKRKQRVKVERNPNFPSAREVNSALDDPDFLKYLELRQDALLDENPHVSQDDIVKYLYKTWVYEQNLKTETEINDEIENANLVKGLNDQPPPQPKKFKKKVKEIQVEKEFKLEKDTEVTPKDKPRRKATKQYYHEDETDIEDELEVFEIFKMKSKQPKTEPSSNTDEKTDKDKTETALKDDEPKKEESEEEDLYDIETYFQKLLQPKPNLFKGLARERVCEICFKSGKLVKCKGPCCGTFHIECVRNENIKEEDTTSHPAKRGRKKKTTRPCPWLRFDVKKENSDESISDEKDEPVMVIDADDFETKLAAKMKEILNPDEVIDIDSSSDEEITWTETKPGQCEIINVKLKIKQKIDNFKCNNCQNHDTPICFVCKSTKSPKNSKELQQRCTFAHCHKFYHVECLDHWPQTQISENRDKSVIESLTCPRHVCHTCVSDDPRGCKTRFSGDKLAKCVMCPATYHSFTKCLPAGSRILSASHILCPRHYDKGAGKVPSHVNAGWCFICALGGTLICCEYCPTSFHAECLQIKPPEGNYMCEDCETGRLPLYGEMVWVKLGHYRWWPGIVLHPTEIPDNIKAMKHSHGEFVVRFFGQYDHYWVNRGRVFPFQEGDSGRISSQKSKIDEAFTVAIEHASRAFEILKNAPPNGEEDTDIQSSLLPPHYVKLRVNKPVGSLVNKKIEDLNSLTQCECDPRESDPCGVDSQCLNRMLLTECGPLCAAGDRCNNRMFEKRLYPRLAAQRVAGRGWGLRALEDIAAGRFVIEYVGELVDEVEFQRRMRSKHEQRDDHYYFLTLDKDRVIDAGPKGNLARFMNHSCEPNCETQKWTVLGDVRVGLFALNDIPANSELTFNYNLECTGIEKKRCLCGAKRCSGYIGAKPKTLEETQPKKTKPIQKRTYKKRKIEESPPIKKVAKPRTTMRSKPKELTEIEKDLLIIKNATNSAISSDSETSSRLNSVDTDEKKALKRKRVNFSSEEVGQYTSDSSPSVKRLKTDEIDSVSEKSDTVPVV